MKGMVPARRRAEEFAAAVERNQLSGRDSADTRIFFELVAQLRDLESPAPRPKFVSELRARLVAEAPSAVVVAAGPVDVADPVPFDRYRNRRRALSVAATTCIIAGTGVGFAAASQSALPGDLLYPVKRGIEQLQIRTAGSQGDQGREYLEQADTRLTEVEDLAITRPDDPTTLPLIREALDDFTMSARDGGDAILGAYREESDPASVEDLRAFTNVAAARLDEMTKRLPGTLDQELADAAQILTQLDTAALQLCPTCSALPPLQLSAALAEIRDQLSDATIGTDQPALTPGENTSTQPGGGSDPTRADPTISLPTLTPGNSRLTTAPGPVLPSGGNPTVQQPVPSAPVPNPTVPNPTVPVPAPTVPVPTIPVPVPTIPVPTTPLPAPTVPVPTITVPAPTISVPTVSVPSVPVTSGLPSVPLPSLPLGPLSREPQVLDTTNDRPDDTRDLLDPPQLS